jgi:hypothetical protein
MCGLSGLLYAEKHCGVNMFPRETVCDPHSFGLIRTISHLSETLAALILYPMTPPQTSILPPELEQTLFNKDERFAAAFLGISSEGLRTWRKQGRSPNYRKLGKLVRYSIESLRAFVEAQPIGGSNERMPKPTSAVESREWKRARADARKDMAG